MEEHQSYDFDEYDANAKTDEKKDVIIQLGIENGLSSKYTSFVGVDEKTKTAINDMAMMTREIKNQVPAGFGFGCESALASRIGYLGSLSSSCYDSYDCDELYDSAICNMMPSSSNRILESCDLYEPQYFCAPMRSTKKTRKISRQIDLSLPKSNSPTRSSHKKSGGM